MTGDTQLDATLVNINAEASADLKDFKSDLSVSFNIPVIKFEYLFTEIKMTPAEVYLTLELAKITKKPVKHISDSYKKNRKKGWGAVAKEMGIKAGSKDFKQLKGQSINHLDKIKKKKKQKKPKKNKVKN
ncbi:MAG: hypothetical protein JW969_19885 [Spirochaetales bacterium]|nr:hypothetical protein [Spirochaetales bacterium]